MIILNHNLNPRRFNWLWAKYVRTVNDTQHCTNSIHGVYSKHFSKHNPDCLPGVRVVFDEQPPEAYRAIYICGVSSFGYAKRENYRHNVHAAIIPCEGVSDQWEFEEWNLSIQHGRFSPIPRADEIPLRYRALSDDYTTCRIFRWAVCQLEAGFLQASRPISRTPDTVRLP